MAFGCLQDKGMTEVVKCLVFIVKYWLLIIKALAEIILNNSTMLIHSLYYDQRGNWRSGTRPTKDKYHDIIEISWH